ncbi:CHDC2 [Bugula neritina]|uniref:CHDC2 n=1 Tax=Bugula neritina TaxID=10212 RepID=A0A7J7KFH5_BUGNE|nr:CHDC2 [Bugula neritina]
MNENIEDSYMRAVYYRDARQYFFSSKYTCSAILMNENIGEFLYTIEVKAVYPQISALPFKPGPHSVRISSAAAASRGLGQFGGRDDVIYWKCEVGQLLEEVLTVPMTNIRREEALITAAHQQMTEMEYDRRRVTGTLNSSTITTQAVELLTVGRKLQHSLKQPKAKHHQGTQFTVTLDSKYFSCPAKIFAPHPNSQPKPKQDDRSSTEG